jgi:hypothetical protein
MNISDTAIKNIKLTNGDQIISAISTKSSIDLIILEYPFQLNLIKEKNNNIRYYFTKYMPLSGNNIINLNVNSIVAYTNVSGDVEERYIQAVLDSSADTDTDADEDDDTNDIDDFYSLTNIPDVKH